jgi:long-chain fatty acid transport protein
MAGTGTATSLDSLGGLFWNPATLSGLPCNEVTLGAEALMPHPQVTSTVPANTFGLGAPPVTMSDATNSDFGAIVLPNFGWSHHIEDSNLTVGLGLLSAAGLSVNYPASLTNPVLTPPPPLGLGVGRVYTDLEVFQIVPAVSLQVTDHLSVGFSPIIDIGKLQADPLTLVAPIGFLTFPDGTHSQWQWGAGFQVGAYLTSCSGWNFGISYKSPQWFERFTFDTTDALGRPQRQSVSINLPSVSSVGVSYSGLNRWLFAADARFIDYHNANGFGQSGFAPDGSVRGLGWDDQFVIAVGAQYQLTDRISVRAGYSYNTNPEPSNQAFFNIGAPTIIQNTVYTGASLDLSKSLTLSAAYVHAFQNQLQGPIVLPTGPVLGTSVQSQVSADAVVIGLTVRY